MPDSYLVEESGIVELQFVDSLNLSLFKLLDTFSILPQTELYLVSLGTT